MTTAELQIDSTNEIVTPENTAFQYRVAGPFRRLWAYLLDLFLRFAVMSILTVAVVLLLAVVPGVPPDLGYIVFAGMLILWFVLDWSYGGLFETFWNGRTPGKWLLGIRVVSTDGEPINGLQAMARNILTVADMFPLLPAMLLSPESGPAYMFPTYFVGLIVMAMNRRHQRVGDLVARTMVIIEDRSWLMGVARLEDPRAAQLAAYIPPKFEVSRSLAKALATYVERRGFFSLPRRREIARHLGEPLVEDFGLPRDTSHDLLLCALYHRTFIDDRGAEDAPSPFGHNVPSLPAFSAPPGGIGPLPQEQVYGPLVIK